MSAVYFAYQPPGPTYHGESLDFWLEQKGTQEGGLSAEAVNAIHRMGTNAVPRLIGLLQYNDQPINRTLQSLLDQQSLIRIRLLSETERHRKAYDGLKILGPAASAAVPNLIERLGSGQLSWPFSENEYVKVLFVRIGSNAVPALNYALTNRDVSIRVQAVRALGYIAHQTPEITITLIGLFHDPDYEVKAEAMHSVAALKVKPEAAVPALIRNLGDTNWRVGATAALTLGKFGERAKVAVPALQKARSATQRDLRYTALDALRKIEPWQPE